MVINEFFLAYAGFSWRIVVGDLSTKDAFSVLNHCEKAQIDAKNSRNYLLITFFE